MSAVELTETLPYQSIHGDGGEVSYFLCARACDAYTT